MARYPKEFLDKLNSLTDVYELISEYTTLTPAGNYVFTGLCPLPDHNETNGSLTVFTDKNSWCCFGCGAGSNALAFLTLVNNWNFHQAVEYLCERLGIQKPNNHKFDKMFKENRTLEAIYRRRLELNRENSLDYLLSRGLNLETIHRWGLGANGANRIMFPLYDRDKNILEFSKRYIIQPTDKNDKYWHPSNYADKKKKILKEYYNKSSYLYGIHLYDFKYGNYVYFCEGNLDVILADQYGLKNCFSTFGTNFSESHLGFLQTTKKAPVFIYDGDEAGIKGMHKACARCIEAGIKPYVVILESGIDLADLALQQKSNLETYILSQITPYAYYIIKSALEDYQLRHFKFQTQYHEYFKECMSYLGDKEYSIAKSYILQQTHILVESDKKRNISLSSAEVYCEIEYALLAYRKNLYMFQEPYFKIFYDNLRTLNTEDRLFAQTYIQEITNMKIGGFLDEQM